MGRSPPNTNKTIIKISKVIETKYIMEFKIDCFISVWRTIASY